MAAALLIVDVQNDFLPPNGSLGVQNGRDILKPIQILLDEQYSWPWKRVVASMDFHPPGHISFASSHPGQKAFTTITVKNKQGKDIDQILWPDHCVQGTEGCEIEASVSAALEPWKAKHLFHLVQKGTDIALDAYSAFASPEVPSITAPSSSSSSSSSISPLAQYLHSHSISRLVICGIATDVCVHATVKDALAEGFKVILVEEACAGVSAQDSEQAVNKMRGDGVTVVKNAEELRKLL